MKIILLLMLALLGGCSTMPERDVSTVSAPNQPIVQPWESWQVTGRISVRNDQDGWIANMHWQQLGDHYRIEILGPLGQGAAVLVGGQSFAQLRTSNGQLYSDQNPDALLRQVLGVNVPVSGLRFWIHGLVDPKQPEQSIWNLAGLRTELRQSGWTIEYKKYVEVEDRQLPGKIRMRNHDYFIQLQIDNWQKGAPELGKTYGTMGETGSH